ncbi:MAG: ATP-binding protein [Kangiellaceae bacterium]|jgi:signal transduction histidine kinase
MSNSQSTEKPQLRKPKGKFYFPWITIASSLGFVILQGLSNVNLIKLEQLIASNYIIQNFSSMAILTISMTLVFEYWLFSRSKNKTNQLIEQQHKEVNLYSQSKRKQQQRANQYSDHTEKLKGFIADKLIEYMDFDEKFIHFKGIAAEVRHNGVISYDKITTALNKAIEQQGFLTLYEQQNSDSNETNQQTIDALVDYQSALDAMRYLWALLDLSTADNLSMHIGNQLIDCEENYYRLQLDQEKSLDITQSIPVSPTFEPQLALLTTFSLLIHEVKLNNRITLAKINPAILQEPFYFENEQFRISIAPTPELLGNPNHIILLLENLIKNAQFFSTKSRFKQATDRVGIRLEPHHGSARFLIYNRGPLIDEDTQKDIFKLGFSTRRTKEHHGKGLGLFFAKEIVTGYQGSISAHNIYEKPSQLILIITLLDDTQICFPIEINTIEDKIHVRSMFEQTWMKEFKLTFEAAVSHIEVANAPTEDTPPKTLNFEVLDTDTKQEWLYPADSLIKRWLVSYQPQKKHFHISFKPLSIAGVEFEIKLPTAESHLDS